MKNKTYCVIMAGGIGSRFWPISRASRPKQFLDILDTGKTFLRATYERFLPIVPTENFLVVTNAVYRDLVLEQIPELLPEQVLCEPVGRNTAPCAAYAAYRINAADAGAKMIVTPADHLILDEEDFCGIITKGLDYIADSDKMMTIGIKPSSPNTGYGYIQLEDDNVCPGGITRVKTFTEKPDLALAEAFVASGEFLWNSGIFIWSVETFMRALAEHLPEMYGLFNAVTPYYGSPQESELIRQIYSECRSVSVDIGIMEKARNVYVCCGDFGWSDIGTWGSLYDHSPKDAAGNVAPPDALLSNTEGCIVKVPQGRTVVVEGLNDYMVVDSGDVLMICPRSREQDIKRFVEELKYRGQEAVV
ncbi:MAG: sugar phosphate nucleotidyltransferase [Rikenellaceae bacterium]|nr:sugar phosphate nucleotidyltransferase [Rikenellaceae bacterium]MCL2691977.1 sugar phosphate nucleotidyltransferase [Rikenellaceae bacterium]